MIFARIVSFVKDFLDPKDSNTIIELDLSRCLGRKFQVQTESGSVYLVAVDKKSKLIDGMFIDKVTIIESPSQTFSTEAVKVVNVGQPMEYYRPEGIDRTVGLVTTSNVTKITTVY